MVLVIGTYRPTFSSQFLPRLEVVISNYQREQEQKMIRQLQQELAVQQQQSAHQQQVFHRQLQEQAVNQQQLFHGELQEKLAEQQTRLIRRQEFIQNRFQQQIVGQKAQIQQQQEDIKKCRRAQLSNFSLVLVYYVISKLAANGLESNDHTANLLEQLYGVDRGSLRANLELLAGGNSKRKNFTERKYTEIRNRFEEAKHFFKEMDFPKGVSLLNDLETKILSN